MGFCGVRLRPGICPVYVRDGQDRCKLKVVLLRVEGAVVNKTVFIFARTHQCAIWPFCLQRFRLVFFEMALSGYNAEAGAFRESRDALAVFAIGESGQMAQDGSP